MFLLLQETKLCQGFMHISLNTNLSPIASSGLCSVFSIWSFQAFTRKVIWVATIAGFHTSVNSLKSFVLPMHGICDMRSDLLGCLNAIVRSQGI